MPSTPTPRLFNPRTRSTDGLDFYKRSNYSIRLQKAMNTNPQSIIQNCILILATLLYRMNDSVLRLQHTGILWWSTLRIRARSKILDLHDHCCPTGFAMQMSQIFLIRCFSGRTPCRCYTWSLLQRSVLPLVFFFSASVFLGKTRCCGIRLVFRFCFGWCCLYRFTASPGMHRIPI